MRSNMAQVDPLPLVPPTVIKGTPWVMPRACLTRCTRSRPRSIGRAWMRSTYASQSESDSGIERRTCRGSNADGRHPLQQSQDGSKSFAQVAPIDDEIDGALLQQEFG